MLPPFFNDFKMFNRLRPNANKSSVEVHLFFLRFGWGASTTEELGLLRGRPVNSLKVSEQIQIFQIKIKLPRFLGVGSTAGTTFLFLSADFGNSFFDLLLLFLPTTWEFVFGFGLLLGFFWEGKGALGFDFGVSLDFFPGGRPNKIMEVRNLNLK